MIEEDASASKSRAGHVITCADYSAFHNSKLQNHAVLSAEEAEHIVLQKVFRDAAPIVWSIREIKERRCNTQASSSKVTYKIFKDSKGALTLIHFPNIHPWTKCTNQMH